ncbi:hypothetical protein L873DRAFT_1807518 [Choiromyces venosus 120613-1]|uniref:Uncharacterized protein n=1 Tax=Choiromyces venosus 120613-1 TaxID=1336337 RepID=A0A3N4JNL4_9PEZI|nr:hypothetical protein L873DRAFT_1807518 [Choiromyces venosus 120613-1]
MDRDNFQSSTKLNKNKNKNKNSKSRRNNFPNYTPINFPNEFGDTRAGWINSCMQWGDV